MRWTPRAALDEEPLPNLMRKVISHALDLPTPAAPKRGRKTAP
jgi:A/G-specific adenine glycosylase